MVFDLAALVKYLLEGLAVVVAAYVIPQKNLNLQEVLLLGLTAAATFALLDMYSPTVAHGSRLGSGFGIGMAQVGGTCGTGRVEDELLQ